MLTSLKKILKSEEKKLKNKKSLLETQASKIEIINELEFVFKRVN